MPRLDESDPIQNRVELAIAAERAHLGLIGYSSIDRARPLNQRVLPLPMPRGSIPTMRIMMVTSIVLSLVVMATGQTGRPIPQQAEPDQWWYNAKASPLTIEFEDMPITLQETFGRKTWFGLKNRSDRWIVRYELGCVAEKSGGLTVVSELSWGVMSDGGWGPGYFAQGIFDHTDPAKDEAAGKAACRGNKVAVVAVQFNDGDRWSIDGLDERESPKARPN